VSLSEHRGGQVLLKEIVLVQFHASHIKKVKTKGLQYLLRIEKKKIAAVRVQSKGVRPLKIEPKRGGVKRTRREPSGKGLWGDAGPFTGDERNHVTLRRKVLSVQKKRKLV